MLKRSATLLILCAFLVVVPAGAQQGAKKAPALTPDDYAEIYALYPLYVFTLDGGDGDTLAEKVFTADAIFMDENIGLMVIGRDELRNWGKGTPAPDAPARVRYDLYPRDDKSVRHTFWNVMIEPAPWGAAARAYLGGGWYHDTLVKTPEGWRFKQRRVTHDYPAPARPAPVRPTN